MASLSRNTGIVQLDPSERIVGPSAGQAANGRQRARSAAIVLGAFALHLCLLFGLNLLETAHATVTEKTLEIPIELVTEPAPDLKKAGKSAAAASAKDAQKRAAPAPAAKAEAQPKQKPEPKSPAQGEAKEEEKAQAKQAAKLDPAPKEVPKPQPAKAEPPAQAKAEPQKPRAAPDKPKAAAETKPTSEAKPAAENKPPPSGTKSAETKPPVPDAKPPQAASQPPEPPKPLPALAALPTPGLQPMPQMSQVPAGSSAQQADLPPTGPRLPPMSDSFSAVAVPSPTQDGDLVLAYKTVVFSKLELAKQFPEDARKRHAHGSAIIAFALDDKGNVTRVTLVESSGDTSLDVESLALVERAAPFPPPPAGAQKEFAAVIEFDAGK